MDIRSLIGKQLIVQVEKRTDERMREMNPKITSVRFADLPRPKPQTLDARERFIDEVREAILCSEQTYREIAEQCDLSPTTVNRLAQGYTRWPRDTTLFPLLESVGLELTTRRKRNR